MQRSAQKAGFRVAVVCGAGMCAGALCAAETLELTLLDGRMVRGTLVARDAETIAVLPAGAASPAGIVRLPLRTVSALFTVLDHERAFAERAAKAVTAADWLALARWCQSVDLADRVVSCARMAVELDPIGPARGLLLGLGQIEVRGSDGTLMWVDERAHLAAQGLVRDGDATLTRAELEARMTDEAQARALAAAREEQRQIARELAVLDAAPAGHAPVARPLDPALATALALLTAQRDAADQAATAARRAQQRAERELYDCMDAVPVIPAGTPAGSATAARALAIQRRHERIALLRAVLDERLAAVASAEAELTRARAALATALAAESAAVQAAHAAEDARQRHEAQRADLRRRQEAARAAEAALTAQTGKAASSASTAPAR